MFVGRVDQLLSGSDLLSLARNEMVRLLLLDLERYQEYQEANEWHDGKNGDPPEQSMFYVKQCLAN